MFVKNLGEIEAVAFDIDGTLYPQWALTVRALPRYIRHGEFFLHYGLVRHALHKLPVQKNLHKTEVAMLAKRVGQSEQFVEKKLDDLVYSGLAPYFQKIAPYPYMTETIAKFKAAGLKIALLSDFPPKQKGDVWGAKQYCDVILGTEELGALKPDPTPFLKMAEALKVEAQRVLYVGNSAKFDIDGAHRAGLKSAYLVGGLRKVLKIGLPRADISFFDYRHLQNIVLGSS